MAINTLLTDPLLLRDQVVPAVEALETSSGSQAAAIAALEADVATLEGDVADINTQGQLISVYLPNLISADAKNVPFRLPSAFWGWEIVSIRGNTYGSRDGTVEVTVSIGATPIAGGPLSFDGAGGATTDSFIPSGDNVIDGTAIQILVGGANTTAGDGDVWMQIRPPA